MDVFINKSMDPLFENIAIRKADNSGDCAIVIRWNDRIELSSGSVKYVEVDVAVTLEMLERLVHLVAGMDGV